MAMHRQGLLVQSNLPYVKLLANIVQLYEDGHWESHMSQGLAFHAQRRFADAIRKYTIAKESILGDPNVANKPNWLDWVAMIETQIEKAKKGLAT